MEITLTLVARRLCLATGVRGKTTYVSEHISSDRGNFFLSSRGTLSSIELRVLKAFPPTEGAEKEGR